MSINRATETSLICVGRGDDLTRQSQRRDNDHMNVTGIDFCPKDSEDKYLARQKITGLVKKTQFLCLVGLPT